MSTHVGWGACHPKMSATLNPASNHQVKKEKKKKNTKRKGLENEKVSIPVALTNLFNQEKKTYHLPLISLERLEVNEGSDKLSWNSTAPLLSKEKEKLYQFSGSLFFVRLL